MIRVNIHDSSFMLGPDRHSPRLSGAIRDVKSFGFLLKPGSCSPMPIIMKLFDEADTEPGEKISDAKVRLTADTEIGRSKPEAVISKNFRAYKPEQLVMIFLEIRAV